MAHHGSISLESLKTKPSIYKKAEEWWMLRVMSRLSPSQIAKQVGKPVGTVADYIRTFAQYVAEFQSDTNIQAEIFYCEEQIRELMERRKSLEAARPLPQYHAEYRAYSREIGSWVDRLHELQGIKEVKSQNLHVTQVFGSFKDVSEKKRVEAYDVLLGQRDDSGPQEHEANEQSGTR